MNSKGFCLLLFFCLYLEILNTSVIKTYTTYNHKFCLNKENTSISRKINNGMQSLYALLYGIKIHGLNCVLYDKKIDILDDFSIREIPYNFRTIN